MHGVFRLLTSVTELVGNFCLICALGIFTRSDKNERILQTKVRRMNRVRTYCVKFCYMIQMCIVFYCPKYRKRELKYKLIFSVFLRYLMYVKIKQKVFIKVNNNLVCDFLWRLLYFKLVDELEFCHATLPAANLKRSQLFVFKDTQCKFKDTSDEHHHRGTS